MGRITYIARQYVFLFVRPEWTLNSEKTQNWCIFFRCRCNWCANFQLKSAK